MNIDLMNNNQSKRVGQSFLQDKIVKQQQYDIAFANHEQQGHQL
jgi:hypothetical protein